MTAIASAPTMFTPAAAPTPPANAGGAPHDGTAGADDGAFARQLEHAHQRQEKAPAAPEGARKGEAARGRRESGSAEEAAASTPPVDARHEPRAAGDIGVELGAATEDDDDTASAPALDVSALLAGWVAPQTSAQAAPRAAGRATDRSTDDTAAEPLAAAGRGAAATDAVPAEALAAGDARAEPRRAEATDAFALPTALPAGAAGAAGGAALAAPADAAPPRPAVAESSIPAPLGSAEFAPALGAEVSLLVKDGVQEARLHLNPAEMGPITVQIQIEGDRAKVTMAAEQAPTRHALEQALPTLAGALRENGLTLSGGGVVEPPRDGLAGQAGQPGAFTQSGQPGQPGQPAPTGRRVDGAATDDDAALAALGRAAPVRARGVVDLYA